MVKNTIWNAVHELENNSFMKFWYENTNEEVEFLTKKENLKEKGEFTTVKLETQNMSNYLREVLQAKNRNVRARIKGCDVMQGFVINLYSNDIASITKVCKHIWEKAELFYKEGEDTDMYYDFLKFLWVENPDGSEIGRLSDIANDHK